MKCINTFLQIIVDQEIVIFIHSSGFFNCSSETSVDHIQSLGSATYQTVLKLLHRWRAYKYQQCIRKFLTDLHGTLDLDLKDHIFSCGKLLLYIFARCAIIILHILCILDQSVFQDQLLKFFFCAEEISLSVLLAWSWISGGNRNRQCIIVIFFHQSFHDGTFSGTGKARNNN